MGHESDVDSLPDLPSSEDDIPDLVTDSDDDGQYGPWEIVPAWAERERRWNYGAIQVYLREPCVFGGYHASWSTFAFTVRRGRGMTRYSGCAPCGCGDELDHCKDACKCTGECNAAA